MTYIEKLEAQIASRPLGVFIPKNATTEPFKGLAIGSAIVSTGSLLSGGLVEVYYEGNLNRAENLQRFEDRALCATGRLIEKYPTVARAWVRPESLVQVGHIEVRIPEYMNVPLHMERFLDKGPKAVCVITTPICKAYLSWSAGVYHEGN